MFSAVRQSGGPSGSSPWRRAGAARRQEPEQTEGQRSPQQISSKQSESRAVCVLKMCNFLFNTKFRKPDFLSLSAPRGRGYKTNMQRTFPFIYKHLHKGHLGSVLHSDSSSSLSGRKGGSVPPSFTPAFLVLRCSSRTVRMRVSMASMVASSSGVEENQSGLLGTQQRSGCRQNMLVRCFTDSELRGHEVWIKGNTRSKKRRGYVTHHLERQNSQSLTGQRRGFLVFSIISRISSFSSSLRFFAGAESGSEDAHTEVY